jgi:hypothetical protein
MTEKYINRKNGEHIVILSEANFISESKYEPRIATEDGYNEFKEYFKNFEFCCRSLEGHCEEDKYTDSTSFIEYERVTRTFSIGRFVITNCPFCGKEFPKELGLEWIHLVEEKFGEEFLRPPKMYELPEEFQTDEWWKKRGL